MPFREDSSLGKKTQKTTKTPNKPKPGQKLGFCSYGKPSFPEAVVFHSTRLKIYFHSIACFPE